MKIANIHSNHMRNDEHYQFQTEFRDIVLREGAEILNIVPHFGTHTTAYNKEDEGIKKMVKSVYTKRIREADYARDEIYSGLVEICRAYTKHPDPAKRSAADEINVLLDTYGNISKKPLNEQTSAVYNLSQDLKTKYIAQVTSLNLAAWTVELEARNITLECLVKDRYDEAATRTNVIVSEARAEVDAAYDIIVERINAFAVIDGGEVYERFIRALNIVIAKYNAILNSRLGRKQNNKPEAEDAPPEQEIDAEET